MFTGLVTDVGTLKGVEERGDRRFEIKTNYDLSGIDLGASISCNGVCLTVVEKGDSSFFVDVSAETCRVTTLNAWTDGDLINLERSLKLGDEMGGHIVSGHVDTVGQVAAMEDEGDSVKITFKVPASFGHLLAAKGSVAINGVSLTVNTVTDQENETAFSVNLIPHTQAVTAFRNTSKGDAVNIEFDMLARYVARLRERDQNAGH